VNAGDVLGLSPLTPGTCGVNDMTLPFDGIVSVFVQPDPPVGTTLTPNGSGGGIIPVGASLEPDADGDGFGDETQDQCPGVAEAATLPCDRIAPETSIRKGTKKSKDGKARFSFSSNEAGATFQCKLKGRGLKKGVKKLKPCTSPRRYKGLPAGRFTFSVVATDAVGNVDATAAKKRFKVAD
jgi:hypothetical protein